MDLSRLAVILFSFVFVNSSFGKAKIRSIKKELSGKEKVIQKLIRKISRIESRLNQKNTLFLRKLEEKNRVLKTINESEKKIEEHQSDLIVLELKMRKLILAAITNSLSVEEHDDYKFYVESVLSNSLKEEKGELTAIKTQLKELEVQLGPLKDYLKKLVQDELTLGNILNTLEERKAKLADTYLVEVESLNKIKRKWSDSRLVAQSKKKRRRFHKNNNPLKYVSKHISKIWPPIRNYINLKKERNGMSLSFGKNSKLRAPAKGTVAYRGQLSTFGNIIILEHTSRLRTIILGNFNSKIKKGSKVEKGQVIGQTNLKSQKNGKIYVELRLNKRPIPIFPYLTSKSKIAHRPKGKNSQAI